MTVDPFDTKKTPEDVLADARRILDDPDSSPAQRTDAQYRLGHAKAALERGADEAVPPSAEGNRARADADRLDEVTRHPTTASAYRRLSGAYADIAAANAEKESNR